eukprot:scaffold870_cov268-Pinguiococcus_pyrenoidosus.AAC.88
MPGLRTISGSAASANTPTSWVDTDRPGCPKLPGLRAAGLLLEVEVNLGGLRGLFAGGLAGLAIRGLRGLRGDVAAFGQTES